MACGRVAPLALLLLWSCLCWADAHGDDNDDVYLSCPRAFPIGSATSCYANAPTTVLKLELRDRSVVQEATGPSVPFDGAPGLFTFSLDSSLETGSYSVVAYEGGTFLTSVDVTLAAEEGLLILGTDKGIYQPGQEVKVRALHLTGNMKMPLAGNIRVSMKNPANFKVFEEQAVADEYGVATVHVPLAGSMQLGTYELEAGVLVTPPGRRLSARELAGAEVSSQAHATIKVDEYVLPKFEVVVDLTTTDVIVDDQSSTPPALMIYGRVHGTYTYGERVPGVLTLRAVKGDDPFFQMPIMGGFGPAVVMRGRPAEPDVDGGPEDGVAPPPDGPVPLVVKSPEALPADSDYQKDGLLIEIPSDKVRELQWLSSLVIEADIEDSATGTSEKARAVVNLHRNRDTAMVEMDNMFRPGLPHHLHVAVTPTVPGSTLSGNYELRARWQKGHQGSTDSEEETVAINTPAGQTITLTPPSVDSRCCDAAVASDNWSVLQNARQCCFASLTVNVYDRDRSVQMSNDATTWARVAFSVTGHHLKVEVDNNNAPSLQDTDLVVNLRLTSTLDLTDAGATAQVAVSGGGVPLSTSAPNITEPVAIDNYFSAKVQLRLAQNLMRALDKIDVVMMVKLGQDSAADRAIVDVPSDAASGFTTQLRWSSDADSTPEDQQFATVKPGDEASLNIESQSDARVFLLGVDKAVDLLAGDDPAAAIDDPSLKRLLEERRSSAVPPRFEPQVCPHEIMFLRLLAETPGFVTSLQSDPSARSNPCPPPIQPDQGGGGQFLDMEMVAMARGANMEMDAADDASGAPPASPQANGENSGGPPQVRKLFPETWIFEEVTLADDSEFLLAKQVPDSITEWRVAAFATHQNLGFSDAGPMARKLRVRKDVFGMMSLPPFVVHREEPVITFTVQNLLEDPVELTVAISLADGLGVVSWPDGWPESDDVRENTREVTVQGNSFWRADVQIRPTDVSLTGLWIRLQVQTTANAAIQLSDAVERTLKVKPSGRPLEQVSSQMLQIQSDTDTDVTFTLPEAMEAATEGSKYARFSIVGDILGNAMANLENLVRVPTGCGEQTMIALAPNVYVMAYLEASGRLGPDMRARLVRNMNMGFQRELMYRHSRGTDDGGFSAFGEQDGQASTWLTAYVLKVLSEAADHVSIDAGVLQAAGAFLQRRQRQDGWFETRGRVIHQEMLGGATDRVGLTAFVTMALVAAAQATGGDQSLMVAAESAANYLNSADTSSMSVYTRVLVLRAVSMAGVLTPANAASEAEGLRTGDPPHWVSAPTQPETNGRQNGMDMAFHHFRPATLDVEATGYGIMLLLEGEMSSEAVESAQWLVSQQSGSGGFVSTQDTVVGLESLAKVAETFSANSDIRCSASYDGEDIHAQGSDFTVTSENYDVLQMADIADPAAASEVSIRCRGAGTAVVSVTSRWNVQSDPSDEPYEVYPEQWRPIGSPGDDRRRLDTSSCQMERVMELSACAYVREGMENADALADYHVFSVETFSGYSCDLASVEAPGNEGVINRVDPGEGSFHVYLENFPADGVCVTCRMERVFQVDALQPVRAYIYNYYDPNRRGEGQCSCANATDPERPPLVTTTPVPSVSQGFSCRGLTLFAVLLLCNTLRI